MRMPRLSCRCLYQMMMTLLKGSLTAHSRFPHTDRDSTCTPDRLAANLCEYWHFPRQTVSARARSIHVACSLACQERRTSFWLARRLLGTASHRRPARGLLGQALDLVRALTVSDLQQNSLTLSGCSLPSVRETTISLGEQLSCELRVGGNLMDGVRVLGIRGAAPEAAGRTNGASPRGSSCSTMYLPHVVTNMHELAS
ncbi:hypothetical protein PYCCODRAFT_1011314 [Trametes coccinea BRFM310]|uniref:Uncharacterized protein n=1 Tax=Trametes coccinea (strain BRFM310) TaxID=1353009 RepID=A0A1Y2IEA3_TRAC3|nr:hypothetical protein PYCCODRAFT_1011314 [Trametes coccinea BRFM310]